ncbi:ribonuclease T [Aestuariivirga sp.]|uniref:ribonuclease T2 family protein n=1 Tax=Aestuariivirga sp. TaxID=2650926 RepID=UPI0035934471
MSRSLFAPSSTLFRCLAATAAFVLAVLLTVPSATAREMNKAGVFDYFVLSLSWSPTYCDSEDGADDRQQCSPGKRFAFVVHGLWPQYEQGWPESCATSETWVPQSIIDDMLPIMPSKRLIIHEWKKHGTCVGVSMADYFRATKILFQKIRVPARYLSPTQPVMTTPEQLVTDFVKTNVNLNADMISVQCGNARDRARLSELRICLDRRGNFSQCGANEDRQCRAKTLVMPPVR